MEQGRPPGRPAAGVIESRLCPRILRNGIGDEKNRGNYLRMPRGADRMFGAGSGEIMLYSPGAGLCQPVGAALAAREQLRRTLL